MNMLIDHITICYTCNLYKNLEFLLIYKNEIHFSGLHNSNVLSMFYHYHLPVTFHAKQKTIILIKM